ncbi:uncharacterized protein LTR77_002100 [Saxophila tyrrhenica]|uniref:O-methyltransferase C-terminal domain-containing protein n=1 Tax=Saxophila tyrrhenica TaxID=1690608 RepID=A0AAV9PI48_9PEZI|nr:hypothetical protein LTR77_002100 [Saxophila tyrrhenica]
MEGEFEGQQQALLALLVKTERYVDTMSDGALATDSHTRKQILDRLTSLKHKLQTPMEQAWDIFFQPHHLSVLQTAMDAGWLQILNDAGREGVTVTNLAAKSGADASLVRRLIRFLAAAGTVKEVDVDVFAAIEMTEFFSSPAIKAGLRHASHEYTAAVSQMPEYFANNGYQSPPNVEYGIFAHTYGTSFFRYLSQRPVAAAAFNEFMAASKQGSRHWGDVYPVEWLQVQDPEDVLLVDVGGGKGHELAEMVARKEASGLRGKLVLQDLAKVLDEVPEQRRSMFDVEAHDFFTPQPESCRNARTYYMRSVLHDWPDEECVTILSHLRDAMRVGYSSVLINDIVLPDRDISFWSAAFDVTMMAVVCGKERARREWEGLIGSVEGLLIEGVWEIDARGHCVIEVRRTR